MKLEIDDRFKNQTPRVAKTASDFYHHVPITEVVDIGKRHGITVKMGCNEDLIKLAEDIHSTKNSKPKNRI
jgi:hypothetical protein